MTRPPCHVSRSLCILIGPFVDPPLLSLGQENLKKLVDVSERCKRQVVPIQMVKDILSTTTQDVADDIIAQIPSGKSFIRILMLTHTS